MSIFLSSAENVPQQHRDLKKNLKAKRKAVQLVLEGHSLLILDCAAQEKCFC